MLNFFTGKKLFYFFYKKLLNLALKGLNYSSASIYGGNGERNLLKMLKKQLSNEKSDLIFFDIGANVGVYSESIATIFNNFNYQLFSFEPSLPTFEILKNNLGGNKKIQLLNFGLSDKESEVDLFYDKEGSKLSSVYLRNIAGENFHKKEKIKTLTLDDFCKQNEINDVDFLKLDVEGHELSVLNGAKNLLNSGKIKAIQFEFGGCNIDSRTYFKDFFFFLTNQYELYRIMKDGVVKIDKYTEKLEIFQSSNYLAVNKKWGVSF